MSKSMKIITVIINVLIAILLCSFFTFGVYYLIHGRLSVGAISVGIGCVALGVWILILTVGPTQAPKAERVQKSKAGSRVQRKMWMPSEPLFKAEVDVLQHDTGVTDTDVKLAFSDEAIFIEGISCTGGLIRIVYDAISEWHRDGFCLELQGTYEVMSGEKFEGSFSLTPKSALKIKACEQLLLQRVTTIES